MIQFRQKQFGFLSTVGENTLKGAGLGASIGGAYGRFRHGDNKSWDGRTKSITFRGKNIPLTAETFLAGGLAIGASLGALYGVIKGVGEKINQASTVNARTMQEVVKILSAKGWKEGSDFTRDPKKANDLKTKVCLVVTKNSGELSVLVNMASDSKLQAITDKTLSSIPGVSSSKNISDKFNDITMTAVSGKDDAKLISDIADVFIRSHYPVYLVEVG